MIIANPIYDVVFKKLMENERVAKFFIGTLLDQEIVTLEVQPQEYVHESDKLTIMRLDFVATLKTDNGEHKKVMIEIQKSRNRVDLMKFRSYLGEHYKKEELVENQKVALPITTIYLLGFQLPEINSPCIKVERQYKDLVNNQVLDVKSDFVEKLTHNSYIVQVSRIKDRFQTRLDKLLSIFEQRYFVDDSQILKEYNYTVDSDELTLTTSILQHTASSPTERKKIEDEREAWRSMQAIFGEKEEELVKKLADKEKALKETEQALKEKELENQILNKKLEKFKRMLGEN